MEIEHVILDLDQTLIAADYPSKYKQFIPYYKHYDMDGKYVIFERPFLQEFLDYLFKRYKVSIWTAASMEYATFIIDNIITPKGTSRKLEWFFWDYHCHLSKKVINQAPKGLKLLWGKFNIDNTNNTNTIIIDDNPDVYKAQKKNCVFVPEFMPSKVSKDTFLKDLVARLEEKKSIEAINQEIGRKDV
jgi:TFIIF-interacting CTD phosphatase-like protein